MDFDTSKPSSGSFTQSHRMKPYWWILLSIPFIFNIYFINSEISEKHSTWLKSINPSNKDFNSEYLLIFGTWILLFFLLLTTHLKWSISREHLEYSFFPFIRKKQIPTSTITQLEVIKIKPLVDFGGWGIRYSKKYGRAYTTSGKYVLHIEYGENKKLNLTVTNPEIAIKKINSINN